MTEDIQSSLESCEMHIADCALFSGLNPSLADELAVEYSRQDIAALLYWCWYSSPDWCHFDVKYNGLNKLRARRISSCGS